MISFPIFYIILVSVFSFIMAIVGDPPPRSDVFRYFSHVLLCSIFTLIATYNAWFALALSLVWGFLLYCSWLVKEDD